MEWDNLRPAVRKPGREAREAAETFEISNLKFEISKAPTKAFQKIPLLSESQPPIIGGR